MLSFPLPVINEDILIFFKSFTKILISKNVNYIFFKMEKI